MAARRTVGALAAVVLLAGGCQQADEGSVEGPEESPADDEAAGDPADEGSGGEPGEEDDGSDAGAEAEDDADEAEGDAEPDEVEVAYEDLVTGLDAPWDVAFAGDRAFVTERDTGRVLEVGDDGSVSEVRAFDVDPTGEGGLLGLTVDDDGRLYAYLSAGGENQVVRFEPDGSPETILDGIPHGANHNGGRLALGPDGMLYVATGDAGQGSRSQDEGSLAGKILRVTPDGDAPDDNPIDGSPVWSLGHRNVQGLAWDADGRLWASEFGPDVDDEINVIEPGGNYGWPEVTGEAGVDAYVDPALVEQPPDASWSGLVAVTDGAIPQWEGDLLATALRGNRLWRLEADGDEVTGTEELLVGEHGRLRQISQAPDGSLWMLTNNTDGRGDPGPDDDRIIRIAPTD